MKMKIKVNKIGIAAVAIAVAVSALGGGYYYTTQFQNAQKSPSASAATTQDIINSPRDGISIDPSQMGKLKYTYSQSVRRNTQTEVQDFNMYYVNDDSDSRKSILGRSNQTIGAFIDSIDKTRNGVASIGYIEHPDKQLSEIDSSKNNLDTSLLPWDRVRNRFLAGPSEEDRLGEIGDQIAKNSIAGRQNVLIFESDFMDFGRNDPNPQTGLGFLNTGTVARLKQLNTKVVLIGDQFAEKTLTPIEDGFSYRISSTAQDGSFLDRGEILRMFVQTTVKETITSSNTAYELSLRGTSYKFSPGFLNEVRKNRNFVVEGEDFVRMKVPEFNATGNGTAPTRTDVAPLHISIAFSGVDVVYRSNSTQPQAVEYLSVKKDAASDRIAINFTAPTAQEQTIYVNDEIKAEDSISNVAQLPNGATYKFKEEVDVSTKGKKEATVVVVYGDGMVVEVPVIINVLPKSNVTVKYLDTDGKELKPEVKLLEQQKEGTEYKAEQLDIEGYKFLKLDEKSAQVEGKLGEEDLEVIFVYEKVIVAPNTGLKSAATLPIILAISSVFGMIGAFWAKRR